MKQPIWLSEEAVVSFHEISLSMFGGPIGIRDIGLLRSALDRPRNRFTYEETSLPELAATYATSIIQNHPFIDGNKRTGFISMVVLLERNGLQFIAEEAESALVTLELAAGTISEAQYAAWIQQNTVAK